MFSLTRWLGKVSADSGQLQDYGDPEVDSYIRSLEDRIERLRAALETCASELEHEIRASYDEKYGGHPAMERRLERDLQSVRDARTALKDKP